MSGMPFLKKGCHRYVSRSAAGPEHNNITVGLQNRLTPRNLFLHSQMESRGEREEETKSEVEEEVEIPETPAKKKPKIKKQHVEFVPRDLNELDEIDVEALEEDDDDVLVIEAVKAGSPAPHQELINTFINFTGDGTVDNIKIIKAFNLRNWLPPSRLPRLQMAQTGYTSPITVCGEVVPCRPILDSNQHVVEWEFIKPVVDGRYQQNTWNMPGVVEYRGGFSFMHVWVRYVGSILNVSRPAQDKAWLQDNASTIGQSASPDNGKTWGLILTIKTPHVKTFMDLAIRNDKFKKAYTCGMRPLVCFTDCVFNYNPKIGCPQFQTTYPQGNKPGNRSEIIWVGNYKQLPAGFASQMASQAIGANLTDANGQNSESSDDSDSDN